MIGNRTNEAIYCLVMCLIFLSMYILIFSLIVSCYDTHILYHIHKPFTANKMLTICLCKVLKLVHIGVMCRARTVCTGSTVDRPALLVLQVSVESALLVLQVSVDRPALLVLQVSVDRPALLVLQVSV